MKTLFATTLFIGLGAIIVNSVEKTGTLVDNSKVTYNVTEDNKLNGPIKITDVSKVVRLSGAFTDNKRSGNWYAFDADGKMALRYNYTAGKLVALDQTAYATVEIKVIDKDPEVTKNARIPVPICDLEQYKKILLAELEDQLPGKERAAVATVNAEITAMVDAKGEAKYVAVYAINGVENKATLFLKDKIFNIEWLPAQLGDKTYKSEVKFSGSFKIDPSTHAKRFIWNY